MDYALAAFGLDREGRPSDEPPYGCVSDYRREKLFPMGFHLLEFRLLVNSIWQRVRVCVASFLLLDGIS
jgi:hypothetical protein